MRKVNSMEGSEQNRLSTKPVVFVDKYF